MISGNYESIIDKTGKNTGKQINIENNDINLDCSQGLSKIYSTGLQVVKRV